MVTVEAESEFNNIAEVSDYLFNQARAAVDRQIHGGATKTTPATVIPISKPEQEKKPESREAPMRADGKGSPLAATQKQVNMVQKLCRENFADGDEAKRWLSETFGADNTTALTRKTASRVIDALLDRARRSA
jgi:hypothetical protein